MGALSRAPTRGGGSVIGFLRFPETLNIEEGREDRTCADTRQPGSAVLNVALLC